MDAWDVFHKQAREKTAFRLKHPAIKLPVPREIFPALTPVE